MKKIYAILCLLISFNTFSQGVEVSLEPKAPVFGEQFDLIFKIKLSGSKKPKIQFSAGRLKVLGRRSGGMSINTSIVNGRFTTVREMTEIFTLVAPKPGTYEINDARLIWRGGKQALAGFKIDVLNRRGQSKNFFLKVIPSKTTIYFNEGVDVNFYLYFQPSIRLTGEGVEEFPKFPNFIKRFHTVKAINETVTLKGNVYGRRLLYSARLYPEKVGNLSLDPIKVTIQYYDTATSNNSFGGFGAFGFRTRRTRQTSLVSEKFIIKVLPFPKAGKPSDFTGLVGNHEFKLDINKNKFLINEAVELKLSVQGPGALEHFDAPKLFQTEALEDFDTKSELTEIGITRAKKTFDYTYLARSPINLKDRKITFSIFDPSRKRYIKKEVTLPNIIVGGVSTKTRSSFNRKRGADKEAAFPIEDTNANLLAPVFSLKGQKSFAYFLILGLVLILVLQIIEIFYGKFKRSEREVKLLKLCNIIQTKGPEYSIIHQLILQLAGGQKVVEPSISKILNDSNLSPRAKSYFSKLIKFSESKSYRKNHSNDKFNYEDKYFNELRAQVLKR